MRLETEFFPQNLVSFYHNSAGCAVRALQIVLFKQVLRWSQFPEFLYYFYK